MSSTVLETSVSIRIPAPLAAELRTVAARENNGISAIVRRLLSQAIERERQPNATEVTRHDNR